MDTKKKLNIESTPIFPPIIETLPIGMEANHRSLRVMMIGPGSGIIGGISTLVDVILPAVNNSVQLYYFPTVSNRPIKRSGKFTVQNLQIMGEQYSRFFQAVKRFHPQIIHLHTSQGIAWVKDTAYILYGKLKHCKVVVHLHAADFDELYTHQNGLVKLYTRWVLSKADAVITVSDLWKKQIEKIVRAEKVHSFRNCIKIDLSPNGRERQGNAVHALFLGSIGPRKGAFDLIGAAALIDPGVGNFHIWLAGYEERLGDMEIARRKINELGLQKQCELVGVVKGQQKLDLLQQMDFFVLPSHNEGLPMAILEAMAAGKPVISCPVGGISEIIHEGENGFLVPPGDIKALAARIGTLVREKDLRSRMGKKSLQIVEDELSVNAYVGRLTTLYGELMQ